MIFWILVAGILAYFFWSHYATVKKLPPGPFPFPLIGNIPQMAIGMLNGKGIVQMMMEWQKIYGDVFTTWLGPMTSVNICNYQLAQDVMVKRGGNFSDRPWLYIFHIIRKGKGIIFTNGEYWSEQRRFALHTLRNFGLGKNVMEDRIMMEFDFRKGQLDEQIEKAGGTISLDPYNFLNLTVGNIINRILFTDRFVEEEESVFFELKKNLDETTAKTSIFDLTLTEESVNWPILKQRKETLAKPVFDILDFIKRQVKQRQTAIASGEREICGNPEDFVDAFLMEMTKDDKGDSFDEETLYMTLLDLWIAGQETTTTTLQWALGYLSLNPHVTKKLQEELDKVTQRNRHLSLADKVDTPYLNAVVLEVFRVSMLVPMNIPRVAKESIQIGNYHIQKGTVVTAQLSVIMSSQSYFKDPEKFDPLRFFNNENEQMVIPFGLGKRACLGEALARAETYLILGNIVLNYNIAPNPMHPASMKPANDIGAVRKPQAYELMITRRD